MKLVQESNVRTTGIEETQAYGVKVGAKMFSLTMDKLYGNKLGSTIREVSSNAYDSQRSAGKFDTRFSITTPTEEDQEITIQDFGTGLPNDKIFKLFGTLFESSKDQGNSDVGGFGLGSKSPFSIADTFTIESNWKGVKTYFLNYKDSHGVPNISISSTMTTEEPNGIKVIIPIDYSKRRDVAQEIKRQLYFFEPRPLINGEVQNDDWWNNKPSHHSGESNAPVRFSLNTTLYDLPDRVFHMSGQTVRHLIKIGPVAYPLDVDRLSLDVKKLIVNFRPFRTNCSIERGPYSEWVFVSDFAIGELDIAPSRESLSYIPDTVDRLNAYFMDFFSMEEQALADFLKSKTTAIERLYWFNVVKINQYNFGKVLDVPFEFFAFGIEKPEGEDVVSQVKLKDVGRRHLSVWSRPTKFRTNVSARIESIDADTGKMSYVNLDDGGIPLDDALTTLIQKPTMQMLTIGDSAPIMAKEVVLPVVGNRVEVSTMVERKIPVVKIRPVFDFLSKRKDNQIPVSVEELHAIFYEESDHYFYYDDGPKKAKDRLRFFFQSDSQLRTDKSYVISPDVFGDNQPHTTLPAIIKHISEYCGISYDVVESKFMQLSSLDLPPVEVKERQPAAVKPPKIQGELMGVHWDNRCTGTAGIVRNYKKELLEEWLEHADSNVFLMVPILEHETLKRAYERISRSSYRSLSSSIGTPIAYISQKTTAQNIEYLKEKGGVTPEEYIVPIIKSHNASVYILMMKDLIETSASEEMCGFSDVLSLTTKINNMNKECGLLPMPKLVDYFVRYAEENNLDPSTLMPLRNHMGPDTMRSFCRSFDMQQYNEICLKPNLYNCDRMYRRNYVTDTLSRLRQTRDLSLKHKGLRKVIKEILPAVHEFIENKEHTQIGFQMLAMLKPNIEEDGLKTVLKLLTKENII